MKAGGTGNKTLGKIPETENRERLNKIFEDLISKDNHVGQGNKKPTIDQNPEQPKKTCFDNIETRLIDILEEQVSPVLVSIEEIKELLISDRESKPDHVSDEKLKSLSEENESLKKQLYEVTNNDGLQQLFEKYKGKTLEYQTKDGDVKKIKVSGHSDIITALVETIIDKQ